MGHQPTTLMKIVNFGADFRGSCGH